MSKSIRVVFMGTPEFAVPTLRELIEKTQVVAVYTQPDKPVGRGLRLQPSAVKQVAVTHQIPVFTPEKVSTLEEVEKLKTFNADFFVVAAYGQILKSSVIDTPKYGCINIHSSLLPRWRGAAPIQWSILSGDAVSGITTMMIAPKLDAGDMILQESTPITDRDTATSLHDRLSAIGAKLILPTLEGLKNGTLKPIQQDESLVTYASKLTKEMEVLDASLSAREMDLKVRALNPWPGTRLDLKFDSDIPVKIKVKKGKLKSATAQEKSVGKVWIHQGEVLLQCGQGIYELSEVQEEGKKSIFAADFINGLKGRGIYHG